MDDGEREDLAEELRALGRGMRVPDVDGGTMAERVLAQLLADAAPVPASGPASDPASDPLPGPVPVPVSGRADRWARLRRLLRGRWRALAAGVSGLLVVLVLTPPVRAAVADWFDFGGVRVRYDPAATPGPGAPVPGCGDPVPIEEVERRAGFAPRIPAELGDPDQVSLEGASAGRAVVSLCWADSGGRIVRLEEFRAGLDVGFSKQVRHMPQWVTLPTGGVNESTGLWFADPHLLRFRLIDGRGEAWTRSARTAGPTLLWEDGGPSGSGGERLTLRLEGVESLERATAVARSMR
ncbi:hypothetical protein [Streptomyces sp. IB2014 016-6]|uniref:hypothetical protein n=1 Tax=Streptomyces sp. IB2014 016-6 TaxID=2517818 RepID=UPI0011C7E2BF|nr:hypothetical protein [Streptomyces sp. IB2014 016-6]TXL90532.1 hypothetical protein EW053_10190 [Streptomyces sp. IB2014 016-6]